MTSERLIEEWLPINEISVEAIREGGALAGHPPVNQLHVWWARRPLIASRAAVAASMLPVDTNREEFISNLGTTPEVVNARNQMDAVKAEGGWSNVSFPNKRAFLHNPEFIAKGDDSAPVILDLTAGGGSIPFEAGRLGYRTIANELNPVACLILRATCEWPQTFGKKLLEDYREVSQKFLRRVNEKLSDVYPEETQPDCTGGNCPHPQRYRCTENCSDLSTCDHLKLGRKDHSQVQSKRHVWAYLWAHTVHCQACDGTIPLSLNWRLDDTGNGVQLEPDGEDCQFKIVHARESCPDCRKNDPKKPCNTASLHPDGTISRPTVKSGIAICPHPNCGTTTQRGYVAKEAQAGRMYPRFFGIIYRDSWTDKTKAGADRKKPTTFRGFTEIEPSRDDESIAINNLAKAEARWQSSSILPVEQIPHGNKTDEPINYGMKKWIEMFSPRQQLAHGYCVEAFQQCVDEERDGEQLNERRKAAWVYAALALDKLINRNSRLARWDPSKGKNRIVGTFDSHDFGFQWAHAEMAITRQGVGLEWAVTSVEDCLKDILSMTARGEDSSKLILQENPKATPLPSTVINSEAQYIAEIDDDSIDCIVFDPPYNDNVCYAELSDFFYVWLKRTAGYVFPEDFSRHLTEKDLEAIANPARFNDGDAKKSSVDKLATADYESKMAEIFAECRRVIKSDGAMTVMFTHKSTAAWDALTVALINAGFSITRTWPVKTEPESSIHIKDKAAARTTILLVCRPRETNSTPDPWHQVQELIAQEVQRDIEDNLSKADLKPIDLYLSAFGPALKVISEHWGTGRETATDDGRTNPFSVTPTDALQVARTEVSRHRAQAISKEWADSPVDHATKFYILANDANGGAVMEFDEANLLARALGTNLNKQDPGMKSIATFKTDKVSFLSAKDRMAAGNIGENQTPKTNLDLVHTAVALTGRRNSLDAQQWLTQKLYDPQDERFKYTLEALIRTTKPGHDDHLAQRSLWQALYGEEAPEPAATAATQMKML